MLENEISSIKIAAAFKSYASWFLKQTLGDNLNAYDQEGNQPVFNIYIGCQFTLSLTLMKTDAEILILKRLDFFETSCISLLKNNNVLKMNYH